MTSKKFVCPKMLGAPNFIGRGYVMSTCSDPVPPSIKLKLELRAFKVCHYTRGNEHNYPVINLTLGQKGSKVE